MYGRGNPQVSFGPPVTPDIIKHLLVVNCAVYVAQKLTATQGGLSSIYYYGAIVPELVWQHGFFWQPFTYMWLHSEYSIWHLAMNMFSLWMFGSAVALHWGEQRFLRYYLTCGIGAGIMIAALPLVPMILGLDQPSWMPLRSSTVGASGAVMAVLLAYGFIWPDRTIQLLFPPIPLKAIWLIPLLLFMEFTSGPSNVSHTGHLGGIVVGWIYMVNEGRTPGAPTISSLRHKLRRYQMRKNLRAVQREEERDRERWRNDRRMH